MNTIYIINNGVTMEIGTAKTTNTVSVSIDNPHNLCVDNNYNGDYACMILTLDNVRDLHTYLTQVLELA